MQLKDLVGEWQEKSQHDILSARYLVNMRPMPMEVIGFHAQQAVEKLLKAVLVLNSMSPEKTHDLLYLYKMCSRYTDLPSDLESICAKLNPYAVEHRYPSQASVSPTQLLEDLQDAETLCSQLQKYLTSKIQEL